MFGIEDLIQNYQQSFWDANDMEIASFPTLKIYIRVSTLKSDLFGLLLWSPPLTTSNRSLLHHWENPMKIPDAGDLPFTCFLAVGFFAVLPLIQLALWYQPTDCFREIGLMPLGSVMLRLGRRMVLKMTGQTSFFYQRIRELSNAASKYTAKEYKSYVESDSWSVRLTCAFVDEISQLMGSKTIIMGIIMGSWLYGIRMFYYSGI